MTTPAYLPKPTPTRPLTALDIADGALAIMRGRPRTVAGIAAAFVLPTQLLSAWLERDFFSDFDLDTFNTETGQFEGNNPFDGFNAFAGSPVSTILQFLILPFLGVALTHLVMGWRAGQDRSTMECLKFTMGKAHIIIAAFVLAKLLQGVTLMLATPMTMLVAPVIAAEGLGPIAAIRRAWQLGKRRYGALFGLLLLIFLVNLLLTYALLTLPVVAGFVLGDWGWIAFFALGSVGSTVLTLLGTGAAVLAYKDVIERTEGADLRHRSQAARESRA